MVLAQLNLLAPGDSEWQSCVLNIETLYCFFLRSWLGSSHCGNGCEMRERGRRKGGDGRKSSKGSKVDGG